MKSFQWIFPALHLELAVKRFINVGPNLGLTFPTEWPNDWPHLAFSFVLPRTLLEDPDQWFSKDVS